MTDDEHKRNREIVQAAIDKDIIKEALKEWLDTQFSAFGRWTFYGLVAAALAGLVWLATKGVH